MVVFEVLVPAPLSFFHLFAKHHDHSEVIPHKGRTQPHEPTLYYVLQVVIVVSIGSSGVDLFRLEEL